MIEVKISKETILHAERKLMSVEKQSSILSKFGSEKNRKSYTLIEKEREPPFDYTNLKGT